MNLIDTANSYGPEVSERLIGETLHPYPEGLVIARIPHRIKADYARARRWRWGDAVD